MEEQPRTHNRVSMGLNWNQEPTCATCPHLKRNNRWGGWCQHPANRIPPGPGWPNGFTPSQGSDGGCDLHPRTLARLPVKSQQPAVSECVSAVNDS